MIFHPFLPIYIATLVIPIVGIVVCWGVYYGVPDHHTTSYLPTISASMVPFPENRIFPIFMSIEGWILLFILTMRTYAVQIMSRRFDNSPNKIKLPIMWILSFIIPLALVLLASITLSESSIAHNTFAVVFFVGFNAYNILSDWALYKIASHPKIFSIILTWISFGFVIIYLIFYALNDSSLVTAAAVCQYIACIGLFAKTFVSFWDIPKCHLSVGLR